MIIKKLKKLEIKVVGIPEGAQGNQLCKKSYIY